MNRTRPYEEITSLFGREIIKLGTQSRKRYLRAALEYWRKSGFPYEQLLPCERLAQFSAVSNSPIIELDDGQVLGASPVGLRLANSYHPQIWHARSHGHRRSPHDYFQEDQHLLQMLERAPRFWPNNRCWSAQAVRNLARVYGGGRVANFRPVVARNIIEALSREGDVVVDFSAGYGGRLLGCLTLNRTYIGIDPARKQVSGLKRMAIDWRRCTSSKVDIIHGCAEDVLPGFERNSVDLVFSSPPFFNLEVYSNESTQSSARYGNYGAWREYFLNAVLLESRRVLRRGGVLAINVSSRNRCPLASDTFDLASQLLEHHGTINISMTSRPLQRSRNGGTYRAEPIFIFRKR